MRGGLLVLQIHQKKKLNNTKRQKMVLFLVLRERDRLVEDEGKKKEDEGGKSIVVDNKDKVIHSSGHSCFAESDQPYIKTLHHYHSCNWHQA